MVSGGLQALAVLLCVAAAAKLADPARAVTALGQAGLPSSAVVVRLLAVGEVAVAFSVLAVGGAAPALALAALHAGFAAFLVRLRARAGASASCGCFGGTEAPADRLHVVVNVASALLATGGAVAGADPLLATLGDQPALGLPYLVLLAVAVQSGLLVLTELPRLLAATRTLAPTP